MIHNILKHNMNLLLQLFWIQIIIILFVIQKDYSTWYLYFCNFNNIIISYNLISYYLLLVFGFLLESLFEYKFFYLYK
jgi:hypothetical protein